MLGSYDLAISAQSFPFFAKGFPRTCLRTAIYAKDKENQQQIKYQAVLKVVSKPISPPTLLQENPFLAKDELSVLTVTSRKL